MFGRSSQDSSSKTVYNPLSDKSDQESQPEDYETLLPNGSNESFRRASQRTLFWVSIVCVPIFSMCLVGLGVWIGSKWVFNADSFCARHETQYSPILRDVDMSIQMVRFNGSLLKENSFRKTAGPEVDAAWESLGVGYRSLAISPEDAPETGLAPDQVKINPKYGGGFPANVEGLHHLHCLNLVRQALWYNFEYYHAKGQGAFINDDNILRHHVSHCLDVVRQRLMCQPDTGVLGQVWWNPEFPTPFVDFNTMHKCKNFDAIRQWAEERQIPAQVANDFLQPPKKGDTVYEQIP